MELQLRSGTACLAVVLAVAACSTAPPPENPATACPALAGKAIAASSIGLPSGAASVTTATLVAAAPESVNANAVTPAVPEHCRILGRIAPRDPSAQPIQFQINLPTS